jgi:tripartite-type tricarboxylate transporter receptor subunit TctC
MPEVRRSAYTWLGVCSCAGAPQPVVDLLNARLCAIVNSAEFRPLMATSGSFAVSSSPQEVHCVIEDTAAAVAPIISELGIRMG